MSERLVFLVPGFFGSSSVGAVSYFERVEQALDAGLRRRGVQARIVRCKTQATASIRRRADALRRQVLRHGGLRARELHFVGYSTGGLDMRRLLTPGVKIARDDSAERIERLTRCAISVTTPHHGTPLAPAASTGRGCSSTCRWTATRSRLWRTARRARWRSPAQHAPLSLRNDFRRRCFTIAQRDVHAQTQERAHDGQPCHRPAAR